MTTTLDPRFQVTEKFKRLSIGEPSCDDNGEDVIIHGEYEYAEDGRVGFHPDDFKLISIREEYEPVISYASKTECIVRLLIEKHGKNINFVI